MMLMLATLIIYVIYNVEKFNPYVFILDLVIFYISFFIIYNSEIETVFVDKKVRLNFKS